MNRFDVLIAAHGETVDQLAYLLALIHSQRARNWLMNQVYVCSDNSKLQKQFNNMVTVNFVFQQPNKGKPDALNLMLRESTCDFCVQNSADCLPASPYTYFHLLKHLRNNNVGAVSSHPIPFNEGFMFLPNIIWKTHHFVQPKLSGELFSFKKQLIPELPNEIVHDDAWIHHQICKRGYQVVYEPQATVYNRVPETLWQYYNQRKKNVIGNMQLGDKYEIQPPRLMRTRSLIVMALELLANAHGRLDYVKGKIPEGLKGYNLPSTKEVVQCKS